MRRPTNHKAGPAASSAPPGWSVRRVSLADRFAGVTAGVLLGSTAIAGSLVTGGFLAQDHFAAEGRAAALAGAIARAPQTKRTDLARYVRDIAPGAQFAVLDANGATLVRGGPDGAYPRPDLSLQALEQARGVAGEGSRPVQLGAPDVILPLKHSGGKSGEAYVVVARAPSGEAPLLAAGALAAIVAAALGAGWLGFKTARANYRRALAPLQDIASAAHKISHENFDLDLKVQTGDELEATAMAFQRMTRRVGAGVARQMRALPLDPVTRLFNRAEFVNRAGPLVRSAGATPASGALIVCNLVRFRHLNESVGQSGADLVLRTLAEKLTAATRSAQASGGVLARLGADEFALIAPGIVDAQGAHILMRDMIAAASTAILVGGAEVSLTASAGAVLFDGSETDVERLIGQAQTALKRARSERPGVGRVYVAGIDKRVGDVMAVEAAIRAAISRGRFIPYFQPKVDLTSGRITSVEALARWEVPGRGVIEPAKFIPAAENLGLIKEIGEAILRQACVAAAEWRASGLRCRVAVNVASAQFDEPDFGATVLKIVRDTGIAPDMLELEITESAAMKNPAAALRQIAPLRRAGIRLSLDDFGTGHSSLAALTQMPFDVFKIDRQFVSAIGEDEQAEAVVDTILGLARTLDFETVAEGVENVRQEAFLRKRGCTLGQGYLYGKPMPLASFLNLAQSGGRRSLRAVS